jgi:hypothetical protein
LIGRDVALIETFPDRELVVIQAVGVFECVEVAAVVYSLETVVEKRAEEDGVVGVMGREMLFDKCSILRCAPEDAGVVEVGEWLLKR